MNSLLTPEQMKLIEHLKKWKQKSSSAAVFDDLLEIIDLQNKVIEKCREQRDQFIKNADYAGYHSMDYSYEETEKADKELREIMEGKG